MCFMYVFLPFQKCIPLSFKCIKADGKNTECTVLLSILFLTSVSFHKALVVFCIEGSGLGGRS